VTALDQGLGITAAALPRLFEPFYRTEGAGGQPMNAAPRPIVDPGEVLTRSQRARRTSSAFTGGLLVTVVLTTACGTGSPAPVAASPPSPAVAGSPPAAVTPEILPLTIPTPAPVGAVSGEVDQQLAERGRQLFTQYGCAVCHSTTGQTLVGPPLNALYGNQVRLDKGQSVVADDAYLRESILEPDAKIVEGFQEGVMSATVGPEMSDIQHDDNLAALVQYIASLK
jgi:mono/diheme cytochrome c family protein